MSAAPAFMRVRNTPVHESSPTLSRGRGARWFALPLALVLSGCASLDFEATLARTNQDTARFTQGAVALAQTPAQESARAQQASRLLAQPLQQSDAVQLALVNSPALQALLAQRWADAAALAQTGRIANPTLTLEQVSLGDELEIGRRLSFGLLELLTLPQRQARAARAMEAAQVQLSAEVVDQVTQVRQAWVRAVAAQQTLIYAQQVNAVAQSSAELARRMHAVGNFNTLQRARQHAFYADASGQWALAQHSALAAREALVRALGLDDAQAAQLRLPERLPMLPEAPHTAQEVGQTALAQRLDVRMAQAALASALQAQGLGCKVPQLRAALLSGWGPALADKAAKTFCTPISTRQRGESGPELRGAAQEAAEAFPTLFEVTLPALLAAQATGADARAARVQALLATMAALDDTNLVRRGGSAGLAWVRQSSAPERMR